MGMSQQLQAEAVSPTGSWCQDCLPEDGSCLIPEAGPWSTSQQNVQTHSILHRIMDLTAQTI